MTAEELKSALDEERKSAWRMMKYLRKADQATLHNAGFRGTAEQAVVEVFDQACRTIEKKTREWERKNP